MNAKAWKALNLKPVSMNRFTFGNKEPIPIDPFHLVIHIITLGFLLYML